MKVEFEGMEGFHRLKSLWKIEYRMVFMEPFLTRGVSDELVRESATLFIGGCRKMLFRLLWAIGPF